MAKNKFYDAQKQRTYSTSIVILDKLRPFTEEDIIKTVYVTSTDPFIHKLINRIEYVLLDAKVNPTRFVDTLHISLTTIAMEIIQNKKVLEFMGLVHKMYEKLVTERFEDTRISDAYYDILIQLSTYFHPHTEIMVGLDGDTILTMPELYPDTDKIAYENKIKSEFNNWSPYQMERNLIADFNKKGYKVDSIQDIEIMFLEERIVGNITFMLSPFINSLDDKLLQQPFINADIGTLTFPKRRTLTSELMIILENRKRLLPNKGITLAETEECSINGLYIREKYMFDSLYLLYRVTFDGKNAIGFYNTKTKFFYSVFLDAKSEKQMKIYHKKLENYVLQRYAVLTTEVESDLQLFEKEESENTTPRIKRRLNRNNLTKVQTEVEAYIRKLPVGASASDESIELAQKYGISLDKDETFVKPFVKNVRKKNIN